jgi:hypothetical protein
MPRKQVEGHASKQAPANRTTYFEILKFHIIGNDSKYDFTDLCKAMRVYNSGREIMAYIERHGFMLRKGISARTMCDPSRNCGMTPVITEKVIGVWSNKHNMLTQKDVDKLVKLSVETNLKEWKEAISF